MAKVTFIRIPGTDRWWVEGWRLVRNLYAEGDAVWCRFFVDEKGKQKVYEGPSVHRGYVDEKGNLSQG